MIELTYLVLIGAVTASLTAMTWSGFALRFPIILVAVTGHAIFLYRWSWVSEMTDETWFTFYFLTMIPLVLGLVLCLSCGSRSRAAFLALAYSACLAAFMAICNMLLCREDISLSMNGRLFAIWGVVVAFNFAFVFLVARRVLLCHRQSSWWLPSLVVGLMFALLVASGLWPISLVTVSGPDFVVFALAAVATGVAIPALCQPSRDLPRDVAAEDESEETDEEEERVDPEDSETKVVEGVVREKLKCEVEELNGAKPKVRVVVEERNLATDAAEPLTSGQETASPLSGQPNEKDDHHSSTSTLDFNSIQPASNTCTFAPSSSDGATGQALFEQARAIPHRPVPDFDRDGLYLELLCKAAAAGHAPALAKLGDYAVRRGAWVEAYYWMSLAKRKGMKNLGASLREIRMAWSMEGFPNQSENVNAMFSLEAGSIGRALLHLDSGHEAAAARQFLKEHHPEFLR